MPTFLVGSAYAISSGLIIYAIVSELAPEDLHWPLVLAWAVVGLILSFTAIILVRKAE
jgi:hypothetical protein